LRKGILAFYSNE